MICAYLLDNQLIMTLMPKIVDDTIAIDGPDGKLK
jgi:hypothetical protein